MKKQIVIDTETTGLYTEKGDRIIEVGCVELIDRVRTGRTYRTLINPERDIPWLTMKTDNGIKPVHGITNDMVKNSPKFVEMADEFIKFIAGAELIAHKADFDIGFINYELKIAGKKRINEYVTNVICTLQLDKLLYPNEKKHKLDAICDRFTIDRTHRDVHGALIDCELTADVFIEYYNRFPEKQVDELVNIIETIDQTKWERPLIKRYFDIELASAKITKQQEIEHTNLLNYISTKEKVTPIFSKVIERISIKP